MDMNPFHVTATAARQILALVETGLRCYEKAGLPRATALAMIEPMVRETVQNIFELGPTRGFRRL